MRSTLMICLLFIGLAMAAPAGAASATVSTGLVKPDTSHYDPATTARLRVDQEFADFGLVAVGGELDAATDIDEGETAGGRDYGFRSYGAGLYARTAGVFYVVGRYGIARNKIDISGGPDRDSTQQRIGLGVGGSLGVVDVELTATRYPENDDLDAITWISAGLRF